MIRLAEYIAKNYNGKVVEVGIGYYFKVAEYLTKRGLKVIATDIKPLNAPVDFYVDDIRNPRIEIYQDSTLIYSIRPPLEIVKDILRVSRIVGADCIIKPLYGDYLNVKPKNYKGLSFYIFNYNRYR